MRVLPTLADRPAAHRHPAGGRRRRTPTATLTGSRGSGRCSAADQNIPLISSSNVSLVSSNPSSAGISGCFMRTKPLFVQSNLDSVRVYDVSQPTRPALTGVLPSLQFENEAMNCGERTVRRGRYAASPSSGSTCTR